MTDKPRIISTEKDLEYAREMETRDELDAMAATIRALWKERNALTNLGCKAVDLTTEISEGAGKEIAELRALVDTKIEQVVTFCRGEADAVFIKTPQSVPLGTIDRIGKALRERFGDDTLVVLLEGDATAEALDEKEMRKFGWARCGDIEEGADLLMIPPGAKRCPDCSGSGHFPRPKDEELTGEFPAPIERAAIEALPCLTCNGLGVVDANPPPGFLSSLPTPPSREEYPREIVCNGCCSVVAFGPATLRDDSPIIATNLIRPDGKQPRDSDPLCFNCGESPMGIFRLTGGGPFTVRDRARTCLHCAGDGKVDAGGFHTVQDCPMCDGSGHVPGELTDAQRKAAPNGADPTASPVHCPTCNGTGRI